MKTQAAAVALVFSFVLCPPALASRDLTTTTLAGVVVGHLPRVFPVSSYGLGLGSPPKPYGHTELRHLLSNLAADKCNVFSKGTTDIKCTGDVPFKACCDSSSCSTNNSGADGGCPSQYSAGCCPAVIRKASDCLLGAAKSSTQSTCGGDFPVPACCAANTCSVNENASSGSIL